MGTLTEPSDEMQMPEQLPVSPSVRSSESSARRSSRGVWWIGSALIALVGLGVYLNASIEPFPVPTLKGDGTIGVELAQKPSLLATLVKPVFGQPFKLTYWSAGEEAVEPVKIETNSPKDAISWKCPEGTAIAPIQAFSTAQWEAGVDVWAWGPYVGDEGERLNNGEAASTVFPDITGQQLSRFFGRATGYPNIEGNNSTHTLSEGRYFASGAPNASIHGGVIYVRCAVPSSPVCGDYFVDGSEECDNGTANSDSTPDTCRSTGCKHAFCGDGVIDTGETCDDGTLNGQPNQCGTTCQGTTTAQCGNGVEEGSEECDDGNTSNTDECLNTCVANMCGDGYVDEQVEDCDDGKTCMDTFGEFPSGSGDWCESDDDCTEGEICTINNDDGCSDECLLEDNHVCELTEDKNAGVPERSLCAFGAPST